MADSTPTDNKTYTLSEAADILGVSSGTTSQPVASPTLPVETIEDGQLAEKKNNEGLAEKITLSNNRLISLLSANFLESNKEIHRMNMLQRAIATLIVTIIAGCLFLIILLTALFLILPTQTVKLFSSATAPQKHIAYSPSSSHAVLGASTNSGEPAFISTPLGTLLRPFALISLQIVKQVDGQKYEKIADQVVPKAVTDQLKVDQNGDVVASGDVILTNGNTLQISDTHVIANLNADRLRDKIPGTKEGNLAIFGPNGTISGLQVTKENIDEGSITTSLIANGAVTNSKILDGAVSDRDISPLAAIADTKLSQITSPDKVAGSAVELAEGGGLVNNSGISLSTSCSSNQTLVWNGSKWECGTTSSGTITGVTAGIGLTGGGTSGSISVALIIPTSGTTANTTSNSGLEVGASGISMLRGCSDSQVLTWNGTSNVWQCANQTGGSGGGIATVQEGGVNAITSASTLNFGASDFVITNGGAGSAGVALDYPNSHIVRNNQNETINGNYTFSSATPFALSSTSPSISIGNTGTLNITDGTNTLLSLVDAGATGNLSVTGIISGSNLSGTNTGDQTTISGNAGTATALQTPRTINGTSFNGTGNITVTAAAGTLTGTTLNATVTGSSLTSVGTLTGLTVGSGSVSFPAGSIANAALINSGALTVTAGTGLSGGGSVALGGSTTVSLANTAVSPNTYGSSGLTVPTFTVDQQGRITGASSYVISGITNANLSGAAGITNANLANSGITFAGNSGSGAIALGGTLNIVGSGINNAVYSAGTVTITATEADTLASVTGRGASTSTAVALNGGLTSSSSTPITLSSTSPVIAIGNTGALSITDGTNTLLTIADAGTTGNISATGTVTGSNLSGTNTGDQTTISGNAGTATALQTPRTINGTSFDGTGNITVTADANTLTNTTLHSTIVNSSLTSVGTLGTLTVAGAASLNGDTTIASGKLFTITGGSGNPTATNGVIWYDTTANKFKVVEGGSVKVLCNTTDLGCGAGGGGGISTVKEGGTSIVTSATALNFASSDFVITDETAGQAGIAVDYTNSKIVRSNQAETITGGWTFNTNPTIFTTAVDANGGITTSTTNQNLTLSANGVGNVLVNPNAGGQSALIVNDLGAGDIFTASSSGASKFTVKANGDILATGAITGATIAAGSNTISGITATSLTAGDFSTKINSGTYSINVSGSAGSASTATTATNSTNVATTQVSNSASYFPLFVSSSTNGNQAVDLGTGLSFNPSTNVLSTTTFSGAFSGNASTATALQTPRTINGTSFDGTGNITVTAAAGTLTGSTLNATVTGSSLTTVGSLVSGTVVGTDTFGSHTITDSGALAITPASGSNLTLGSNAGNGNVQVNPNAGGQAALMVVDNGSGDLLTASAGATPRFTISNSGNITATGSLTGLTGLTVSSGSVSLPSSSLATSALTGTLFTAGATSGTATQNISQGNTLTFTAGTDITTTGAAGSITFADTSTLSSITGRGASTATALTLSSASNNITVGTLTATGGTIDSTAIGNTTRSSGKFTTLAANSTVTLSGIGSSGTTALCLNGTNVETCSAGSSVATLQSAFTNGNSISFGNTNLLLGDTTGTGTVVIQPQAGGQASLIIKNQGSGDLLTASASGTTRFRITNTGGVLFQGDVIASIGSGASANGSNAVSNVLGDEGSMVPNAGFESWVASSGAMFADGWFGAATSSGATVRDTSTFVKGSASAKVTITNAKTAFYSACMPLAIQTSGAGANIAGAYTLDWYAKVSNATQTPTVRAYIQGYTSKANCQSDTSGVDSAAQGAAITNAWAKYGSGTTAVTGWGNTQSLPWARVHFFVGYTVAGTAAIVNIDGIRLTESDTGQGLDYAENYPADLINTPGPGDVVSLTTINGSAAVKKADKPGDSSALGVVSTQPGQLLDDGQVADPKVPVALAGRIPTNVSTQNGAIHTGDYLTTSNIPGVAVKAVTPGNVIGIAMGDYADPDTAAIGVVVMFVKNSYYDGGNALTGAPSGFTQLLSTSVDNYLGVTVGSDGTLHFKAVDGTDAITFDRSGNATFSGIITAKEIRADHIAGLDVLSDEIASLSANMFGQQSVLAAATNSGDLVLNNIAVNGLATVSGDLRVRGNSLVEGVLSVIDTITANNLIVNNISDFFGTVIFHKDVAFTGRPTFNNDTAGFAVIKKGAQSVNVVFGREYENAPVVTTSISLPTGDDATESAALSGVSFVISKRSMKGFTIKLSNPVLEDTTFSWTAVAVKDVKTSVGSIQVTPTIISPTP